MENSTHADALAEIVLHDLKKRERLRKLVHQPGWEYYMGSILELARMLVFAALLTWFLLREGVSIWGFTFSAIALMGTAEATRQRVRFNALLELMELDKQKAKPRDGTAATPSI